MGQRAQREIAALMEQHSALPHAPGCHPHIRCAAGLGWVGLVRWACLVTAQAGPSSPVPRFRAYCPSRACAASTPVLQRYAHPQPHPARFSHIVGYGATYYSYLFAQCLSARIWQVGRQCRRGLQRAAEGG